MTKEKGVKKTGFQEEVDKVLHLLRQEIYAGQRFPKERLVENALAETYGVSRMVVRQALSHLQMEGLVEIEAYKGASVAPVSLERLQESYEVLSMLEGFAAKLAVRHLSKNDLRGLRQVLDRQRGLDPEDVRAWQDLNRRFHRMVNLKCGNGKLIDLIRRHMHFTTYWFLVLSVPGRIPKNIEEHEAILQALEQRDEERARLTMERHIMGAGEYLTQHLQKAMPQGVLS